MQSYHEHHYRTPAEVQLLEEELERVNDEQVFAIDSAEALAAASHALTAQDCTYTHVRISNIKSIVRVSLVLSRSPSITSIETHLDREAGENLSVVMNWLNNTTSARRIFMRSRVFGGQGALPYAIRASDSNLECIHLSNNPMIVGDGGACCLARVIREGHLDHLRSLKLEACGVGAEGTAALCEALQGHGALQMLSLAQNPLGDDGLVAVGNYLSKNPGTRSVDLEYLAREPLITDRGKQALYDSLLLNLSCYQLRFSWTAEMPPRSPVLFRCFLGQSYGRQNIFRTQYMGRNMAASWPVSLLPTVFGKVSARPANLYQFVRDHVHLLPEEENEPQRKKRHHREVLQRE